MIKIRYYLPVLFIVLIACDKNGAYSYDEQLQTKSSGEFYHEPSGFYLVPCEDRYELSNVQRV